MRVLLKDDFFVFSQLCGIMLKSVFFVYLATDMAYSLTPFHLADVLKSLPLYISIYLTLLSFVYLAKRKVYIALILNFIVSFILLMDFVYLRAFGVPTSLFSLPMIEFLGDVGDSAFDLFHMLDFLFFADVILWSSLLLFFRKSYSKTAIQGWKFISCMTFAVVTGYVAYPEGLVQKMLSIKHRPIFAIQKVTPIGYHLFDSYEFMRSSHAISLSDHDRKKVRQWFDRNKKINKQQSTDEQLHKGIFQGKNVVFIHFESLESSVIGQRIHGQEITPELNKLLSHSFYFPKIKEQVGEGNSADAEFMVLNSLYPLPQGIISLRYPSNSYFAFPKELAGHGYETAAFVGMKKGFMNMGIVLPNFGFKKIFSFPDNQSEKKIGLGIPDQDMFDQSIPYIKSLKSPFFAYMITLTNHVPYKLPPNMQTLTPPPGMKKDGVARYLQSVHYADQAVGSFIEGLKKERLLDQTVLVIYGDHQGVNKYYARDVQKSGISWLKNDKNLPLLIYHSSLKGVTLSQMGGQIDILPTVHHLLGLPDNPRTAYRAGRNLFSSDKGFAALRNGQYVSDDVSNTDIRRHRQKGVEISAKVIQGNLFPTPDY
ncbi:LTA synthase family protein [Brevibacillus choshinensis]|uniref:LTA synthase family protein n=1 Tax=Brevibacillus choshinensis TaxID=54911 RepID=A0ABX7FWV3_BRECH|nr:LTA synthase family protein [Brevibacillus choshinensis]QRG70281.1 LTA synthase family protein [Brevibacillus choshinensis]